MDIVFSLIAFGANRSGKGLLLDSFLEKFRNNYFFVWWMHSAPGHESLFPMINFNCRDAWYEELRKHPERSRELPSCQCYKPIPILWMKPNYIEIDKKSLEYGVNVGWNSWKEYNDAYQKGLVTEYYDPFNWDKMVSEMPNGIFKKPKKLYPKQLLKVFDYTPPITTPSGTKNLDQFRTEMHEAVSICKKEHRPLINSPGVHASDSLGKQEKFSVIAEGLRYIQDELYADPMFDVFDGDFESATPAQLSNHKKVVFLNELRSCCPSAKLSGEKESGVSKRAMYNFAPVKRHCKTWIISDTQSPSDIFDGIRSQFSELKVFKRITPDLVGAENEKFYDRINKLCLKYYENWGLPTNRQVPMKYKMALLKRYHICKLSEMPDNMYCIKNASGEFQFKVVKHASFHHKSDRFDDITKILGTKFVVNNMIRGTKVSKEKTESKAIIKSQGKEIVMLKIQDMIKDGKQFSEISETIKQLELDGAIPDLGNGQLAPGVLGNKYRRWKNNL